MKSEFNTIALQKSIFGDINEDGTVIDYNIINDLNENLDDIKDDDKPQDDPRINLVNNVIKIVYTPRYIDIITKHSIFCLNAILPEEFEDNMTLYEYRESVGSNHLGAINSALSVGICGKISQTMKSDKLPYIKKDGDRKDWEILKVFGDTKNAIARGAILENFTGNGSSNKEGLYWLNSIRLDDSVPMKSTTVTHMYGGLISVQYVSNIRGKKDSDRSSIRIGVNVQHRLHTIFGSIRPKDKWIEFKLHPVNIMNNDFFSKEVE